MTPKNHNSVLMEQVILEWSGKFTSAQFGQIGHKLPSSMMTSILPPDTSNIVGVDLSNNNFFTSDLRYVLDLVQMLPNCKYLNIASNHIGTFNKFEERSRTFQYLKRLCSQPSILFVNVCFNPIGLETLAMLCPPFKMNKTIWIEKNQLDCCKSLKEQLEKVKAAYESGLDDTVDNIFKSHVKFYEHMNVGDFN